MWIGKKWAWIHSYIQRERKKEKSMCYITANKHDETLILRSLWEGSTLCRLWNLITRFISFFVALISTPQKPENVTAIWEHPPLRLAPTVCSLSIVSPSILRSVWIRECELRCGDGEQTSKPKTAGYTTSWLGDWQGRLTDTFWLRRFE